MNKKAMYELGKKHAMDGKKLTPYDCINIDKMLFAEMKTKSNQAKWYSDMRGSFNKGWQESYFDMVK